MRSPGGAASFAGVAAAADAELHAFLDTRGDIDADGLFAVDAAFAFTDGAFCGYDGPFAIAGRAGGNGLHLAEEGIADPAYLAAAAAGGAGLDAVLVFGAAAAAGGAADVFLYLDILGNAFCDLFVIEFDLYAQVAASYAARAAAATSSAAATKEAAEEVVAEDISELAEDIVHIHVAAGETAAVAGEARVAVAVVLAPLIRIAKHFVGLRGFLELIFCGFITGVAIGMELHGHLAVGFFYFVCRRAFRYPQYFVIISF